MTVVLQRVNFANLVADGEAHSAINKGLFLLLGIAREDTELDADLLVAKIAKMRIFTDDNDKLNLSVMDINGSVMIVSNFTLNANYVHGNRPDFLNAAPADQAKNLYDYFVRKFREIHPKVEEGVFGADMQISLEADGPITIVVDSQKLRKDK